MGRRLLMTADAVGGVWRYSLDLAGTLIARGVEATVAVMGPSPAPSQRREASRAGVPIVESPYRLEWMDDAVEEVREAGEWLLTLEQALRPDVVHLNGYAHAALPWSAPAFIVAHSCVRSWWRAVKGESAPSSYDGYTRAVRDGLRAAAAVVAPSEAMLTALYEEYGVPLRARVIANGCAVRYDARGLAACLRRKEPFVFSAGRAWDAAKNMGSVCAVAGALRWPVFVAGDACLPDARVDESERANANAGAPAAARVLGRLSSRVMRGWYRGASIYALPARYEPFGLSVLEAARAGCALVLGDIPSLRENWTGAALFVPPDDRRALAFAINRLIEDPPLRADLARRAACRSMAFTIQRTTSEYLGLYESLLA